MTSKLAELLFKDYRRRVLGLLLLHPDQKYHVRQLARLTGTVAGTLHKELSRLAEAGVLNKEVSGNQVLYSANRECVIYNELSSILRKTSGVADVLADALAPINDDIDLAFVYGSIAKGTDTAKSDIDLFVASDTISYTELFERLQTTEKTLGRTVNPSVYDIRQIRKRLKEKNAFLTRIMDQPKIWVKGSDDDLKAFRKPR